MEDMEIREVPINTQLFQDPSLTKGNHFKGAIKKITLENFMTYEKVTFEPEMGLNIIAGPNGTGKSSISAAICIGLNGSPKLSGREAHLASYIKHGTNTCFIKIVLYRGEGSRLIEIERKLTISGQSADGNKKVSSLFKIDKKSMGSKEVSDKIKELGINLDNVCQYLPQERVSEFANQKPIELLANTQKAIDNKLYTDLEIIYLQKNSRCYRFLTRF